LAGRARFESIFVCAVGIDSADSDMFASSLRALGILDSATAAMCHLRETCSLRNRKLAYFDVAFNMTDEMFSGIYFGKTRHLPDLPSVLKRAEETNVTHMLATPGSLTQLKETLATALMQPNIFVTAGVHPTRCNEFDSDGWTAEEYSAQLKALIHANRHKIVAGYLK
jgi:Tat protein secretion system quality control protein TatD with DNase activity